MKSVSVIGGGLAGCEAAYVIAESGIHVNLFEIVFGYSILFFLVYLLMYYIFNIGFRK